MSGSEGVASMIELAESCVMEAAARSKVMLTPDRKLSLILDFITDWLSKNRNNQPQQIMFEWPETKM